MDAYGLTAGILIEKFLDNRITLEECLAGLDSALAIALLRLGGKDSGSLKVEADGNRRLVIEVARLREL